MAYSRWQDPGFKNTYLKVVSDLAQSMCAPFWWSLAEPGDANARILHNGTICYVHTGTCELGITNDHVYGKYMKDLEEHGYPAIECQLGSSTIYPEKHLIARSKDWDIATFQIPEVFVNGGTRNTRTQHKPVVWPPRRAEVSEVVLFGGFPGVLRQAKGRVAELPFQWVAARVNEVTEYSIVLEPDFGTMQWQGEEKNNDPGGWSGGPVFRSEESGPIARLELVGIIYDFPFNTAVRARHAGVVLPDGSIRQP